MHLKQLRPREQCRLPDLLWRRKLALERFLYSAIYPPYVLNVSSISGLPTSGVYSREPIALRGQLSSISSLLKMDFVQI